MKRMNLKTVSLVLIISALSSFITFWKFCSNSFFLKSSELNLDVGCVNDIMYKDIDCLINRRQTVSCRKEKEEVFVPFSFIKNYFEIYGKIVKNNGRERLEWNHSNSKVINKKEKYDSKGVFMTFENYNVEIRERVKCISGKYGVPISTQWESQGYYYPTQIAQFALSHYSKHLIEPKSLKTVIENAEIKNQNWNVSDDSTLYRIYDDYSKSFVLKYRTLTNERSRIVLKLNFVSKLMLKLDLCIEGNSSIILELQTTEKKDTYFIHYVSNDFILYSHNNHIYYGIGQTHDKWKRLTRDLIIDLQKGLGSLTKSKKKNLRSKIRVVGIILKGSGMIDNITLSTSEHMEQFFNAAKWFLKNQNISSGGWPNPVKRKVANGMKVLEPGWYSSMGQGHALSVLSRAYYHSKEKKYLQAAIRGLRLFQVSSKEGGIVAYFLNKYVWYEEYPTTPSSFILNGFIYSLIGLHDLTGIAIGKDAEISKNLFDRGLHSLKNMLTLFDTGSGTTYDLRHFTLKIAPNVARWDYHATHINQLILLSSIDNDPIFTVTSDRWTDYMNGKKAAHN